MTVRVVEIWTCDTCRGEVLLDVHVAPSYVPPAGWVSRPGGDWCGDCEAERIRVEVAP